MKRYELVLTNGRTALIVHVWAEDTNHACLMINSMLATYTRIVHVSEIPQMSEVKS